MSQRRSALARGWDAAWAWAIADRSSGAAEDRPRPNAVSLLAAAPLVVAGGLALLYGAGAVQKLGQLRSAGVPSQDVLPLVPLPQLLTLGIKQAVIAVGVAPLAFATFWVGARLLGGLTRRARSEAHTSADQDKPRFSIVAAIEIVLLAVAMAGLLLLALAVLPLFLLAFLPLIAATVLLFHHRPMLASGILYALTLVVVMIGSYFYASPAPSVVLTTVGRDHIRGDLLVSTDQNWWITSTDGAIRAVSTARVSSATTYPQPVPRPKSALQAIASLIG